MLALLLACAHSPFRPAPVAAAIPCQTELGRIASATYTEAARGAVRGYLTCAARVGSPPPDLPERVRAQLTRNGYESVQGDALYTWFFDLAQIGTFPRTPAELEESVTRLRDQALAREAMGEKDVAAAARARAESLQGLANVLEAVAEG